MSNLQQMKAEVKDVLENNILRYWIDHVTDHENGGYYGRVDGHDEVHPTAEKGAILNARILWAFSAAYRVLHKAEYLEAATRARDYILDHFIDKEEGGVYWSLDYKGNPLDTKKQTYAIGFTIYGLSEYARATGDKHALHAAIGLYHDIEDHAFDADHNGYIEALTRDWQPIADMRLSDKDENGSRTMNTHLHIIEPYTNLYRVWPNEELKADILNLLDIFTGPLHNPKTNHLDLFFDDSWQGKRNIQSYGHDIEAVWLLHEAALVLGDKDVLHDIEEFIRPLAAAADEGLQPDGSMIYERWIDSDRVDRQRQWWVQCESVIGHLDLYQYFGDQQALDRSLRCWEYTKDHLIDYKNGEWHWAVLADGSLNLEDDKAGFWKCPYHNSRMCLEVMER
ncbi:MAG: AGE family epimerase/isomerase [Prevotellaceae bacterium]|nr:AGE family epimerase/isomerase [Prevotellaceae bacterium]